MKKFTNIVVFLSVFTGIVAVNVYYAPLLWGFKLFLIPSTSMSPTLLPRYIVFVDLLAYQRQSPLVALCNEDYDSTDGFEVTFATISVGVTVISAIAAGPAGLVATKTALVSFKGFLKAIIADMGIDVLYRGGRVTAKYVFHLLKLLVTDSKQAKKEMLELGRTFIAVAQGAGTGMVKFFLKVVHSVKI